MQTKIVYTYRDTSNYKFHGDFAVDGLLLLSELEPFLFDSEFFIPHEVGLKHLLDIPMNANDHYLHSFTDLEISEETETLCTSKELVARFRHADDQGWFSSFE